MTDNSELINNLIPLYLQKTEDLFFSLHNSFLLFTETNMTILSLSTDYSPMRLALNYFSLFNINPDYFIITYKGIFNKKNSAIILKFYNHKTSDYLTVIQKIYIHSKEKKIKRIGKPYFFLSSHSE